MLAHRKLCWPDCCVVRHLVHGKDMVGSVRRRRESDSPRTYTVTCQYVTYLDWILYEFTCLDS